MRYQIDQSGKVEFTSTATVLALANGKIKTIKISGVEKRKLIESLRELRRPHKTYGYDIFAALIYLLIKDEKLTEVEIDREYPGHENGIKERLIQFFERDQKDLPEINFGLVGKQSNSHIEALKAFQKDAEPGLVIKAKDVLGVIYSKKKGWRPQSGRGNP